MNFSRDIDMVHAAVPACHLYFPSTILLIAHDMAVTSTLEIGKQGLVVDNPVYICLIDTESVKSGRSPTT